MALMTQAAGQAATWQVITGSARGAAHRVSGLPNQDAVASQDGPGAVVVAVADGHGHIRHFRSADGAALAEADERWQPRVGRDLAELAACHDRRWFGPEVTGWAQRCASVEGSGDDATIALVLPMYRGGHMRPSADTFSSGMLAERKQHG